MSIAEIIVRRYIRLGLFPPKVNWPDSEIQRRSYSKLAAEDLIRRFRVNPNRNPADIAWAFVKEMDRYCEIAPNKEARFIFETEREVAEDILLQLL